MTTILLDDLTPFQVRTLFKLDDGHDDLDHVGRMAEELTANQVVAAEELAVIGLTERYTGLLDTVWFRLTSAGRSLRTSDPA